ncbi:hypothetical protein BAL199_13078 [alpha proteobacterium BAL199]|nr:hypothetical protein BAL199_13078 [alpha proteobacterium BAL199]
MDPSPVAWIPAPPRVKHATLRDDESGVAMAIPFVIPEGLRQ